MAQSYGDLSALFIKYALQRVEAIDMSTASITDVAYAGALLDKVRLMAATDPKLATELGAVVGFDVNDQYVGFAYNTATDTFVRLGKAVGTAVGTLISSSLSPIFSRLRRVVLTDAGTVYKGISWTSKTTHEDGSAVSLSGANGQIMVEYMPGYYSSGVWGNYIYFCISHLPLPGFALHPVFEGYSAVYLGAYEGSLYSNKLYSIAKSPVDGTSPVFPVTTRSGEWGHAGLTTQATDALAVARGTGWMQRDLLVSSWERILMLVGYASFNIPGLVGQGRVYLSGGGWTNDSLIGRCGLGDATSGYASAVQNGGTGGYLTDFAQVLGVENPWGNVWERVGSLVSDGAVYYKSTSPSSSDYNAVTGWTRLLDADKAKITLPTLSGWAGVPKTGLGIIFPSDVTGSSSTKMMDYYYYDVGLRVLLVGGDATYGTNAGPFYWHAHLAASYTYASICGRLCFKRSA
jgi:hypothetical protein